MSTSVAERPTAGTCPLGFGASASATPAARPAPAPIEPARVVEEAYQFLRLLEREGVLTADAARARIAAVTAEIERTGSYVQTYAELEYGAKLAWRNSSRCIGRLYWQKLQVRDLRHLDDADAIFDALVEHLRLATNGGKIQSMITVFATPAPGAPGIRIWNPQLIRYAGYRQADGRVLGDPSMVEFTEVVRGLGWEGEGTAWDVLPLVIEMPGEAPRLYEVPRDAVLEVPITHPEHPGLAELGLRWHALPAISAMRMEIGGVSYGAAPFNGWYMGTEIGARNFADESRYDLLPDVARVLGLDVRSSRTLWRDRAMVELNVAVLHSFHTHGVTMIDHHAASKHFVRHEEFEREADRPVPGDWSWLVPPMSGAASPLFHREYHDTLLKPNFFYQANAWPESQSYAAQHAAADDPARAERDALTGLLHRAALDLRLARFRERGGAIALVDVDHFGALNAAHGQMVGNAVLRAAARALLGAIRPDDECARAAGDEFCVLLGGIATAADAAMVGERVRRTVGQVAVEGASTGAIGVSVGVALVGQGGDVRECLRAATAALRAAKEGGRDRVVVSDVAVGGTPPAPRPTSAASATSATPAAAAPAARCPWMRLRGWLGR